MPETDLVKYYSRRAPEFEEIYQIPERQGDLSTLREYIRGTFRGRQVLEIACGTGYWTEILAESAASVFATDVSEEVLEIARAKNAIRENNKVQIRNMDAYTLEGAPIMSACLMGFWWSHMPRERIAEFLRVVHSKLRPGATVVIMDNRYVERSSTAISRTDEHGNTYQSRRLKNSGDDSNYEVLKNFPTKEELFQAIEPYGAQVHFDELRYYWILRYELRGSESAEDWKPPN